MRGFEDLAVRAKSCVIEATKTFATNGTPELRLKYWLVCP